MVAHSNVIDTGASVAADQPALRVPGGHQAVGAGYGYGGRHYGQVQVTRKYALVLEMNYNTKRNIT